jgi:hypothetical protein
MEGWEALCTQLNKLFLTESSYPEAKIYSIQTRAI